MDTEEQILALTQKWLDTFVIGLNLCPFARYVVDRQQLHYCLVTTGDTGALLDHLIDEFDRLDNNPSIETTLLVHPNVLQEFEEYLAFLDKVDRLVADRGYEGVYQVASFHPDYQFAGTSSKDPANHTNRSPYPMLHILREESVSRAIDDHPDIDSVPQENIERLRELGIDGINEILLKQ